jgi:MFS family permease
MLWPSAILRQGESALRRTAAHYRAALGERNVALLLGAGFLSEIGDWFNTVALIALAYHFADSALGVGAMLAVRMATKLLVQGPAGTLVDRYGGRTLLFASQVAMALIASAFALLVVVPALWLLYLLVILLDAVNCVARPAFMVELKAEAPEEQRAAANGVLFASTTTAQLIGPLLGALVLAPLGAAMVFMLNGLTFAGVAAAVALMRGGLRGGDVAVLAMAADATPEPRQATAGGGYGWLLRRQDLSLYVLVCAALSMLVQATIALFVVRANALGLGDGGVGPFYAAVAVGSIAGSVVAGGRGLHAAPLFPAAVAMGMCALALAAFGSAGALLPAVVVLVVAGFTTDFYEVVGLTYFQLAIPDDLYGRFFSVFLIALSAGGLIGALAGPALEPMVGVGGALAIVAVPGLALAALLAILSRVWQTAEQPLGA